MARYRWIACVMMAAACNVSGLPEGAADLAVVDLHGPRDLVRAPDLTMAAPPDLGPLPDGGNDLVAGIWLIGWSGQIDHYTWVRFEQGGVARLLDPKMDSGWTPYWDCQGTGSWAYTGKPDTIALTMPAGCTLMKVELYFKTQIVPSTWGSLLTYQLEQTPPGGPGPMGFKYPETQCAPDFTVCTLPM